MEETNPESIEREWHGDILRVWLREDEVEEAPLDPPLDDGERRQLADFDRAVRVHDNELRVIHLIDEEVTDDFHVLVTHYADARRKPRIHYVEGDGKQDALHSDRVSDEFERDDAWVEYIGTARHFLNNADEYDLNLHPSTQIPSRLRQAIPPTEFSRAWRQANPQEDEST